jgi:hypothetical protein
MQQGPGDLTLAQACVTHTHTHSHKYCRQASSRKLPAVNYRPFSADKDQVLAAPPPDRKTSPNKRSVVICGGGPAVSAGLLSMGVPYLPILLLLSDVD